MIVKHITKLRQIRFILAGSANTIFNFLVLNMAFYFLHESKIISSIIATSLAMILSFYLNRNFVFRHKKKDWLVPLTFIAVTLIGVLLIQNLIYYAGINILKNNTSWITVPVHNILGLNISANFIEVNLSNVFGSVGALLWNYNGYRLFVFKNNKKELINDVEIPS